MRFMLFTLLMAIALIETNGAPAQDVDSNLERFFIEADDTEQSFYYRMKDGQVREETTSWHNGKLVITGRYRYLAPDGVFYEVLYVANENGFQPIGAHLSGANPNMNNYGLAGASAGGLSKTCLLSLTG
uniref:Uncharacterized protein n=1 Tax=Anopheles atroparvus TaxID=41427 RepID=A0AAG5DEU7_ANOAO